MMTAVFAIDVTKFDGNPLKAKTPFGEPVAISIGDLTMENGELRDEIDRLRAILVNHGVHFSQNH